MRRQGLDWGDRLDADKQHNACNVTVSVCVVFLLLAFKRVQAASGSLINTYTRTYTYIHMYINANWAFSAFILQLSVNILLML